MYSNNVSYIHNKNNKINWLYIKPASTINKCDSIRVVQFGTESRVKACVNVCTVVSVLVGLFHNELLKFNASSHGGKSFCTRVSLWDTA